MKLARISWIAVSCAVTCLASAAQTAKLSVQNPLNLERSSETIVLQAVEVQRVLGVDDVRRVHVTDDKTGKELLTQAVDINDDGKFEEFLFQIDMGPNEMRSLTLSVGARQELKASDFKAYGRFVRERRDDFAWENDRIAHRMYGAALETWAQEPLTSSAVDVWSKRTRRLIVNDWYMVDDYHRDHGEGADLYSSGSTRGCGGNGLWVDGKLYPSANFRSSRVLANGPIRVMFELMYDAWDAHGTLVSETKRITLDAGQNLDHFESFYKWEPSAVEISYATGIKKSPDSQKTFDAKEGVLRTWETLSSGQLGCAVVFDPNKATEAEDNRNFFVISKSTADHVASYYAGFGWSKSGDFPTLESWDKYLAQFAQRLRSPLKLKLMRAQ